LPYTVSFKKTTNSHLSLLRGTVFGFQQIYLGKGARNKAKGGKKETPSLRNKKKLAMKPDRLPWIALGLSHKKCKEDENYFKRRGAIEIRLIKFC
jgi:hypothetical protein